MPYIIYYDHTIRYLLDNRFLNHRTWLLYLYQKLSTIVPSSFLQTSFTPCSHLYTLLGVPFLFFTPFFIPCTVYIIFGFCKTRNLSLDKKKKYLPVTYLYGSNANKKQENHKQGINGNSLSFSPTKHLMATNFACTHNLSRIKYEPRSA